MFRKRLGFCLAGLLALAAQTQAQTRPKMNVSGLGAIPCDSLLRMAERPGFHDSLGQWVAGFYSGLNADGARNVASYFPADAATDAINACRLADQGELLAEMMRRIYPNVVKPR